MLAVGRHAASLSTLGSDTSGNYRSFQGGRVQSAHEPLRVMRSIWNNGTVVLPPICVS